LVPSKSLLIAFFPLLTLSCTTSGTTSEHARAPVPADLKITVGSGGGISGLWKGYSILASDSVLEWEGKSVGDNVRFAGRLSPDTLALWWDAIRDQRLLDRPSRTLAANFVQLISVSAGGTEHIFMWEPGIQADTTAMSAQVLRARCLNALQNSLGH
jgi:hypothetical protein